MFAGTGGRIPSREARAGNDMPPLTALIVEDYEEFRRFLRVTLQENGQCKFIAEVSDGLQAVRQAQELQPDLVLLDLALPNLNGMEVGRRIRKICPNCKIIFLSQDSSPEVVEGVLRIGALGYLLKSDATELPVALEAVLNGMQFVSRRLRSPSPRS
jgi:DNA-binding NarL/FixJ family response regulator